MDSPKAAKKGVVVTGKNVDDAVKKPSPAKAAPKPLPVDDCQLVEAGEGVPGYSDGDAP